MVVIMFGTRFTPNGWAVLGGESNRNWTTAPDILRFSAPQRQQLWGGQSQETCPIVKAEHGFLAGFVAANAVYIAFAPQETTIACMSLVPSTTTTIMTKTLFLQAFSWLRQRACVRTRF